MTEEKDAYPEQYRDHLEKMMGSFIPRILHLENLMNDIMSRHFSSGDERGVLFFYSLTPQMSFKKRIDMFLNMLRIHFNDIYRTYEKDLKKLHEIDDHRAHLEQRMLNITENVLNNRDDRVQCTGSKNGKSITRETDNKEHERKIRLCSQVTTALKIIQREIILRAYHS
jgi:hypothetical protein